MNVLLSLLILAATLQLITPAPEDHLQEYELSMLNQLHKSQFAPKKHSEYPLKGEYPCKGGVCKTKVSCEDCQYSKLFDD